METLKNKKHETKKLAIKWSLAEEYVKALKQCLDEIRELDTVGIALASLKKQIKEL